MHADSSSSIMSKRVTRTLQKSLMLFLVSKAIIYRRHERCKKTFQAVQDSQWVQENWVTDQENSLTKFCQCSCDFDPSFLWCLLDLWQPQYFVQNQGHWEGSEAIRQNWCFLLAFGSFDQFDRCCQINNFELKENGALEKVKNGIYLEVTLQWKAKKNSRTRRNNI